MVRVGAHEKTVNTVVKIVKQFMNAMIVFLIHPHFFKAAPSLSTTISLGQ